MPKNRILIRNKKDDTGFWRAPMTMQPKLLEILPRLWISKSAGLQGSSVAGFPSRLSKTNQLRRWNTHNTKCFSFLISLDRPTFTASECKSLLKVYKHRVCIPTVIVKGRMAVCTLFSDFYLSWKDLDVSCYYYYYRFSLPSPDIIPSGRLSSKQQLTNHFC